MFCVVIFLMVHTDKAHGSILSVNGLQRNAEIVNSYQYVLVRSYRGIIDFDVGLL